MKILTKTIEWLIFSVLIVILLSLASPLLPTKDIISSYVISSGSMEPELKTGGLVFTTGVKPEELQKGDIITFQEPTDATKIVVHRIIAVENTNGLSFKTKGDNNDSADNWTVLPALITGKSIYSIPYLGFLVAWLKTPLGFAIGVGIPALLFIFLQIRKIFHGINEEVERRTRKALENTKNVHTPMLVVFLALGLFTSSTTDASALFSSSASIQGITIKVGAITEQPILQFFKIPTEQAVQFTIQKTLNYVEAEYTVTYKRDNNIQEGVQGTIKNDSNASKLTSEKIVLGTCSSTDCTYHSGVKEVFLTVKLKDALGKVVTLEDSLSLESSNPPIALPAACQALSGIITDKIIGTNKNEILRGTSKSELIIGMGGNDIIDGGGGHDCILGESGNDVLNGQSGNDIILGGLGNERILGEAGNDTIYGNQGNDSISGGTENDTIFAEDGNDAVKGGSGDDVLDGGNHNDVLDGDVGTDKCTAGEVNLKCEQ